MQPERPDVALPDQGVPAREWADDEGRPLGAWVEIDRAEWNDLIARRGGLEALTVFSSLTDPDGVYGARQVYTAWGFSDCAVPFVDVRDYKSADGRTERQVLRRFVARALDAGTTPIDPVCAIHGIRWSDHEGGRCLYCCICFKPLTPDACAVDSDGQKWDSCKGACAVDAGINVALDDNQAQEGNDAG